MKLQDDLQDYDLVRSLSLKQVNPPDAPTVHPMPVIEYVARPKAHPRYFLAWMFLLSLTAAACWFVGYIAPV